MKKRTSVSFDNDFLPPAVASSQTSNNQASQLLSTNPNCNNSYQQQVFNNQDQVQKQMSQLPKHLRQFVDPSYVDPLPPSSCPPQKILQRQPKEYYDYRDKNVPVKPVVNLDGIPPAKLNRTFGNDDQVRGVQGNTVFHPTIPAQARPFPVTGKEADGVLRRWAGWDKNPIRKAPVLAPTMIPDLPEGIVPGGGRFLSERERDAYANLNPNTIGDYLLPHVKPDIRQWQEKSVSYKKPTEFVREPIIPPSNAGRFTVPNDIGMRRLGESSVPVNLASSGGTNILVDADRYDVDVQHMPREATHKSEFKKAITQERERELTADEELPIPKGSEPQTYTRIKTYHKKLQQPEHLDVGANYAASDEADYDPTSTTRWSADLSQDRAKQRSSNVATGIAHGAGAYNDLEVGQSVLPTIGREPLDGEHKHARKEMIAHSSVLPGRDQDELIGSAADHVNVGNKARIVTDRNSVESRPQHIVHRVHLDADAGHEHHAAQPGGVNMSKQGKERNILQNNVLDDLAYDASSRQKEGLFVRTEEASRKNRIDVRESKQKNVISHNFHMGDAIGEDGQGIDRGEYNTSTEARLHERARDAGMKEVRRATKNLLGNYNIGDAIGEDGQGIDSARYSTSAETRVEQRERGAKIKERYSTTRVDHGASTFNGFNDDYEEGIADGKRIGADPAAVQRGQGNERRRLVSVDLARRSGETGADIEIDRQVVGTTFHRDSARAPSIAARETMRNLRPVLRAEDEAFEDGSSSVYRLAEAQAGDRVVRADKSAERRAAKSLQGAIELSKRIAFADDNYDISAPTTSVKRESLGRERATAQGRDVARFDGVEDDQAPSIGMKDGVRNVDNAARTKKREMIATASRMNGGTVMTDDLIDAPAQRISTDVWNDQKRGKMREGAKQMSRAEFWRAVIENEDMQGIADHVQGAGTTRVRGDGQKREKRLEQRGPGRADGIVEGAEQDSSFITHATQGLSMREVERKPNIVKEQRARGPVEHRLNVETFGGGGDGECVGDSKAVSVAMNANLRESMTRPREQMYSNAERRGGDDVDNVYEADRYAERTGTLAHRKDRSWRDETVVNRFGNADSDALDNPILGGTGMGMKADERVERFKLREERDLNAMTKGRIDDIEDKFVSYTLDPGTVRVEKPIVQVKEEQRKSLLQRRLKCDSPPPENILRTNARFRAMASGGVHARAREGRPMTPQPERRAPRRSDSPVYKGATVCPF